ncbi:hypothetical protein F0Z19_3144 [Vibrio cyclitrophicus]|nr:hypothetical protein M565_ctg1P1862 [Vibrio cyclitrophicus FF75]KAA8598586.1 hypothetical protein F0Z19_3144 [Vibrio cyclitrophicus]
MISKITNNMLIKEMRLNKSMGNKELDVNLVCRAYKMTRGSRL